MLKEILVTTGANTEDVSAVMTIGTPAMGLQHLNGPEEIGSILSAVEKASPADAGIISLDDTAWRQLESAYSRRVVQPLFA